jgi:hypothetical protein
MTRLEAACIGWYRLNATAFDAMADRLIRTMEPLASLQARNEARRQEALAEQIEALDNAHHDYNF